jgi:hypothetical protein
VNIDEIRRFWLPKSDSSEDEYEDASEAFESRFAISDGATESSFARDWARDLVRKFVKSPPEFKDDRLDFDSWLEPIQRAWAERIEWDVLPWNAEQKANIGAFAAFVGIEFIRELTDCKNNTGFWRVIALGDSCLFLVRRDDLFAFPLADTSQFKRKPPFLSSIHKNNREVLGELRICEGRCEDGDYFILATDALSFWFLHKFEEGGRPWEEVISLKAQDEFARFIDELRSKKAIKDDDVTLLIFRVEEQSARPQQETGIAANTEFISKESGHRIPGQLEAEKTVSDIKDAGDTQEQVNLARALRNVPFGDQSMYHSLSHRSLLSHAFSPFQKAWRKIRPKNDLKPPEKILPQ